MSITLAEYRRHRELRPILARNPWAAEREEFYAIDRKIPEGDLLEATSAAKEEAEAKVKALQARALKAEAILAELERMAEAETRGIEYEHQDELMGIWCHDYEPCLTHRLAFAHAVVGRKNE